MELVTGILNGNNRALARAITLVENGSAEKRQILAEIYPYTGKAQVIGITGAPGAGKSSLVSRLLGELRRDNLNVGVIVVDPSSPFTGGALLGDRLRMQHYSLDQGVFIRSMGTRGCLGGLARSVKEVVSLLDASSKQVVLVETAGVGQSELEIMNVADTVVLVLTPGAGDVIQVLKAGIMEIADVFVVNKADLPGASQVVGDVERMLDLDHQRQWRPPVVLTSCNDGLGSAELWQAVGQHRDYLIQSGQLAEQRRRQLQHEVIELVLDEQRRRLQSKGQEDANVLQLLELVAQRQLDPGAAANKILQILSPK